MVIDIFEDLVIATHDIYQIALGLMQSFSDAVNFVRNQLREQGEVQSIGDNLNGMLLLANEGFDKENGGLEGTQVNTRMLRWKNRHMNLHRNKRQKAPTKLQSSCKSCDVMCLLSLI
ncbi:hypothetical protein HanRHA438_Chr05g0214961 [Helianthus annuus]|uniref:Uncharacterized protein n=1 Tax=Helianthus annuus TaxID=4232 RepID=A0A9K3IYN0_HELAN|nr:hypothetical protein HanXRQr2_Chr05g0205251 [Helianthus annuus]KAJ0569631.1 hypothetical protein HanHA300_Chr05g0168501 [Helianthus annuus]KAJ0583941.1 hypothetical protein HanHA89_Chr05g0182551 [Helianthus annuus]KAJ0918198.1 hypothetical protein HanRHA438_Chr05g0214961 [Helianthus annuus]KAJ0921971.1 hypothetical protein HanPSC8_Chr05g0198021 [Helianthus annuus]